MVRRKYIIGVDYLVGILQVIQFFCSAPRTSKQKKRKKQTQNNLFHVQIKKFPVGCGIFRRIRRIEKHIPIGVVERISQRKTEGL
jgi:hypothetical protein